jgi:tetratricopeptide (TPR) repeat protein
MRSKSWTSRALGAGLLLLAACTASEAPPSASELAELDRGVGVMGKFEFATARDVFASLAKKHPQWLEARFNLALATLNRQAEGDERTARDLLLALQREHPDNVRVLYTLGIVVLRDSPKEAEPLLRRVVEADPRDAYAAYFLGQALLAQGQAEQALGLFERASALDPRLRSSQYAAAQALGRLGRGREADARMEAFQSQSRNPLASLVEFKYTRMGPKSEAISPARAASRNAIPEGPLFAAPLLLARHAGASSRPLPSAADIDGDGEIDLFLPGGRGLPGKVLLRRGERFEEQPEHPLARISGVESAAWGDLDNDGSTDVVLCRADAPPVVLRNQAAGGWTPLDIPLLKSLGGTRDCLLFDADHDGDLDLFLVTATGQRVLLSNNGNLTFRSLAERLPARKRPPSATQVAAGDFDNDRSVDLLVLHQDGGHEAFANGLSWNWRPAPGFERLLREPALAAAVADLDATGELDILTVAPDLSLRRWTRAANGERAATQLVAASGIPRAGPRTQIAVADLDGDGRAEIVVSSPRGLAVWRGGDGGLRKALDIEDESITAWTLATLSDKGPSLLTSHADGSVFLRSPGPGRAAFVRLSISGRDNPAASIRSNASGIGARIAARVEGRWVASQTLRQSSGPGQSLAPVAIGLNGAQRIDYLRIDWSDGAFQSEVALAGPQTQRIVETQRQLSSCPVIFAWDGRRYAFVSDLLGVGGLGYLVAPGEYAPPRPWENFLLPDGLLQARDGRYILKISEPMEEAAYIDALHLVAYDLPPGWDMALDERMQIGEPKVSGAPLFFRRAELPQRATNDRGEDVTAAVRSADRTAADPGEHDRRFIGRLAREHVLTLEFASALDAIPGRPLLVADGWIEYPYSQTMFAAWQAKAAYEPPTLEAKGADGRWRVLLKEFGYPAGMPRTMAVPLPPLPRGTRALRLRTTQEIYWDRLAVAWAEPLAAARHELPLVFAEMRAAGFARRATGAQQQPSYDYDRRAPLWDTWAQSGLYTKFGRIDELVSSRDDALAIVGPGEEIHAEFNAALAPLREGWSRRFVLEANGWAKDMDLYTRDRDTLGPLPVSGRSAEMRDRLNRRYNQRSSHGG